MTMTVVIARPASHNVVSLPARRRASYQHAQQQRVVIMTSFFFLLACCLSYSTTRGNTELTQRSPYLVVKDLANQYQLEDSVVEHPFDFCGKKKLYNREVKLCAEYFLASLKDVDGTRGEPLGRHGPVKVKLWGFPKLAAYDRCMMTSTIYQMKACIREITRAVSVPSKMTPDMIHLSRTGKVGTQEAERLDESGLHAITTAGPDSPLEGLNGGANGMMAEYSSKSFMRKFDDVGMPPLTDGCEHLGMDGCEEVKEGGIKPPEARRAMDEYETIGLIQKMYKGKMSKQAVDFDSMDTNKDGVVDLVEFERAMKQNGWTVGEINQAYSDIDRNADGGIDRLEYVEFKHALDDIMGKQNEAMKKGLFELPKLTALEIATFEPAKR